MDTQRISGMEERLNECTQATRSLSEQLDRMDALRDSMISLFGYYGSEEWYEDREGEPEEVIPAGVLSEDAIYDAITDLRDAAFRMLETATDILKNRI